MKKIMILGVEISDISQAEAIKAVQSWLAGSDQHYIVTPNPEIVLAASKSSKLRFIFDNADLSLPDGFGLKIAARILGQKLDNRVAGADFMLQIASLAAQEGQEVFLLGGAPATSSEALAKEDGNSVAEKAAGRLQEMCPGIKIAGATSGGQVRKVNDGWETSEAGLIEKINQSQARILFVAFGCPKQEKWLYHNLSKLESVTLGMTVGGSFDYLAGTTRRAPAVMRQIGLEWLWRLMQDPRRAGRVWNATIGFIWKVLAARLRIAFIYRHDVVGFIVRYPRHSERSPKGEVEESQDLTMRSFDSVPLARDSAQDDGVQVLLVQRANEKHEHWQLPQGGVDKGESEEQAVLREMREETGAAKLEILGKHPQKHSYDWPAWHQRRGSYRGQRQTIFYLRFDQSRDSIKLDQREIKDYLWLPIGEATRKVFPVRRRMTEMAVEGYRKIVL